MSNKEPHETMEERQQTLDRWEAASRSNVEYNFFTKDASGSPRKVSGKTRLSIDFASPDAMWDWVRQHKGSAIPKEAALFLPDSLDDVDGNNQFLLKNKGDRDERFRLILMSTVFHRSEQP